MMSRLIICLCSLLLVACGSARNAELLKAVSFEYGNWDAADVARIKDIVISETYYTADQIKIMEAN